MALHCQGLALPPTAMPPLPTPHPWLQRPLSMVCLPAHFVNLCWCMAKPDSLFFLISLRIVLDICTLDSTMWLLGSSCQIPKCPANSLITITPDIKMKWGERVLSQCRVFTSPNCYMSPFVCFNTIFSNFLVSLWLGFFSLGSPRGNLWAKSSRATFIERYKEFRGKWYRGGG